MAGLFSKKKPADKTILVVDIENASVGCALVRVSPGQQPKLFAEVRTALPIFSTLQTDALLREIDKNLRAALLHASTTAARMRGHMQLGTMGVVTEAVVFLAPPWADSVAHTKGLRWNFEPDVTDMVQTAVEDVFGLLRVTFHALGSAATHTTNKLFEDGSGLLLCTVTGEITELAFLQDGRIQGRATIPTGKQFLIRTLQSHGGLSTAEAHSALSLSQNAGQGSHHAANEPLSAAATQFARHFKDVTLAMNQHKDVRGILVIAAEPVGEWAAQALAGHEPLTDLFAEGTTVRALHTHHLMPYLAAHASKPDLIFMLEALFIDGRN
ncbi:MAG: hypothetical protein WCK46_02765 [Candidatus Adlerbacteria bacterium]